MVNADSRRAWRGAALPIAMKWNSFRANDTCAEFFRTEAFCVTASHLVAGDFIDKNSGAFAASLINSSCIVADVQDSVLGPRNTPTLSSKHYPHV